MNDADLDWLDREYNNRARVPEHEQIFERWRSASAAARERSARASLDLRYGDGPNQTLDVFPAAAVSGSAPVLVFVHGGYWRSLDKSDFSFVAPPFVDAGAAVVVPNYALCPLVTIETIALQLVDAIVWTCRNAALHGGDARRIVVVGHSAGGHLAAMLLACDWAAVAGDLPPAPLRAALSISGLFDLEPLRRTPFLAPDLRLTPESVRRLSPANFDAPRGVVLYTVAGAAESDEFRRQNRLIRDAWGDAAVPVCEEIAGVNHFDILDALVDPGQRLHRLAVDLFERATR